MTEFDGKTTPGTGGGSGIGPATARTPVDQEARVVLAGHSTERLSPSARAAYVNGKDLIVDGGLTGSVPLVPAAF